MSHSREQPSVEGSGLEHAKILPMTDYPKQALPFAVCWKHASGVDFSSADAEIIVDSYQRANQKDEERLQAERKKFEGKTSVYSAKNQPDDPFYSLVTRPLQQEVPSKLICTANDANYSGSSHPTMSADMMLGVYNSSSKKMQLIPFADVFTRMKLKRSLNTEEVSEKEHQLKTPRAAGLISEFSSKSKKRRHAKMLASFDSPGFSEKLTAEEMVEDEKHAVEQSKLSAEAVEMIKSQTMGEFELNSGKIFRLHAPNVDAKIPEDLYNWEEIIPDWIYEDLSPQVTEIVENSGLIKKWTDEKKYSEYVLSELKRIPKDATEEERTRKITLLMFIECMIFTYKQSSHPKLQFKLVPKDVPERLKFHLIQNLTNPSHTETSKRFVSKEGREKIIACMLLVILYMESWDADITVFVHQFEGRAISRIEVLISQIGARCFRTADRDKYTAVLKHPWRFPTIRERKNKRDRL